jgi:prepilin-type N-terminal cleavage/methylation domain-containing protein
VLTRDQAKRGFTLTEVVVATLLASLLTGGLVYGYLLSVKRAEWSAYSLAAQALAAAKVEQTRACKWDVQGWPVVDELVSSNFPPTVEVLDMPVVGTNFVYTTNTIRITELSVNPRLKMVQAQCVWTFCGRGPFTNSVVTYRAPDS